MLAPPRPICDRDFCETEGWVELGLTGTLELFTVVNLAIAGLPDPPYVLAYVKPEGADTAIARLPRRRRPLLGAGRRRRSSKSGRR